MLHHGDCLDVMAGMDPESVDAIVTDPPYGLEFMGKHWDHGVPGIDFWREMLRVAKPSAYLLAFGGTRTVHRMTCAIEDAGWVIRDMLVWGYASGFPKSKASLKPAWEPIVMARKPGPLRMLAIDECRIEAEPYSYPNGPKGNVTHTIYDNPLGRIETPVESNPAGRWPANVVLTDPIFDGGWDGVVGGGETTSGAVSHDVGDPISSAWREMEGRSDVHLRSRPQDFAGSTGTYSRFFLIPKAARSDREPVLDGLPLRAAAAMAGNLVDGQRLGGDGSPIRTPQRANVHPTVKPTDLMRHLVRLVTPTGGVVLDPFLGSGTTALAAEMEGFAWVGIEREAEYVAIAEARLNGTQRGLGLETA